MKDDNRRPPTHFHKKSGQEGILGAKSVISKKTNSKKAKSLDLVRDRNNGYSTLVNNP
jgi:hypothetical protein